MMMLLCSPVVEAFVTSGVHKPSLALAAKNKGFEKTKRKDGAKNQEDIFAKYGMSTMEEKRAQGRGLPQAEAEAPFEPLKVVPAAVQIGLERFLIGGIVSMLVAFVSIGIGITAEAFAVATQQPLPADVSKFIVETMEPAFTPTLFAGFACSISLGALKTLQFSSDGVQYSESD